jgi:hypothetical protein
LTTALTKGHDEQAEGGREHHLVIAVHPSVTAEPEAELKGAES